MNIFKNWVLWLIAVAALVVMFLLVGCGRRGRTPTRMACEIECGTNGTDTSWFRYIGYDGDPITQPGLRMVTHLPDGGQMFVPSRNICLFTEGIWIESTGISGNNGAVIATGERNWDSYPELYHMTGAYFEKPGQENCPCPIGGEMQYATQLVNQPLESALATACSGAPDWLEKIHKSGLSYNMTDQEEEAVLAGNLPLSGIDVSVSLIQQNGSVGNGQSEAINSFVPVNLNSMNQIFLNSFPMSYSYIVKLSEPKDLQGKVFKAKIITDACFDGTTVNLNLFKSNNENTVHIFRTDYFIPEEVEFFQEMFNVPYDPNYSLEGFEMRVYDRWTPVDGVDYGTSGFYENPDFTGTPLDIYQDNFMQSDDFDFERIKTCWIVPIGKTGYVEVEFVPQQEMMGEVMESWLLPCKNLDFSGDGVVNLKDYCYILNQ